MGKKQEEQVQAPTPPSPGQTAREALQAELDFFPQFAEQGAQLTRMQRSLQQELYPEEYAVEQAVGQKILGGLEGDYIPSDVSDAFTEAFRAQEASAGRLGGPASSVNVARQLAMQGEALRRGRIEEALAFGGRLGTFSPTAPGSLTPGSTVPSTLGAASSIYGTQANLYNQQQANQPGSIFGQVVGGVGGTLLGSIAGGAGAGIGGALGSRLGGIFDRSQTTKPTIA